MSGVRRAPSFDRTPKDVLTVYEAADALMAAFKAVNRIPFNKRPALDVLYDERIYPGDLDTLAKQLRALADEWQAEIDAVQS